MTSSYSVGSINSITDLVGTTDSQTLTNKTLTAPVIGTGLYAPNGGHCLSFDGTGTANRFEIVSSAAASTPYLAAVGSDANIGIDFYTKGSVNPFRFLSSGVVIGAPTGSNKGVGTLNATAVYDDNVLLTCMPLHSAMGIPIIQEEWDAKIPNRFENIEDPENPGTYKDIEIITTHKACAEFIAEDRSKFNSLQTYCDYINEHIALPLFPTFKETTDANFNMSTGDLARKLWETVEYIALHNMELNNRLKALEATK